MSELNYTISKYSNASAMITAHSLFWIFLHYGVNYTKSPELQQSIPLVYSFSLLNMGIPFLAGLTFQYKVDKYFKQNRLVHYPDIQIFTILFALFFLESLKGAVTFSSASFFAWNALHFIGLSILITTFLSKWHIGWIAVLSVLSVLLSRSTSNLMQSLVQPSPLELTNLLNGSFVLIVLLGILFIIAAGIFLYGHYLRKLAWQENLKKVAIYLCFFIPFFVLAYKARDIHLVKQLYLLPSSILVSSSGLFHLWPLFPWYSIFGAGFLIGYLSLRPNFRISVMPFLSIGSAAFLLNFYLFFANDIFNELRFTGFLQGSLLHTVLLISAIISWQILLIVVSDFVNKRFKIKKFGMENTLSEGILWAYLVLFVVGFPLSKVLPKFLSLQAAVLIFPIIMHVICYLAALLTIYLTQKNSLNITLKRSI